MEFNYFYKNEVVLSMKQKFVWLACLFASFNGGLAGAQAFDLSGELVMRMHNDYTTRSTMHDEGRHNDAYLYSEASGVFAVNENVFFEIGAVWERMQDKTPHKSNFFDNEGGYIESLNVNYAANDVGIKIGKFVPEFGKAWEYGRGIWGEEFAEDYELSERLGVGVSYAFESKDFGRYSVGVSSFFADTSFLSGSVVTHRGRLHKDDGGASNTQSLSSYSMFVEGQDAFGIDGVYYQLAYRNQAPAKVDLGAKREHGYNATFGYVRDMNDVWQADMLLEYVYLKNFDTEHENRRYFTASLVNRVVEDWLLTFSYTKRDVRLGGVGQVHDYLLQMSAGYDFGQGTIAEFGWRKIKEDDASSNTLGALVWHSFSF